MDARALPSRSRDLSLSSGMDAAGADNAAPVIPVLARRSGRIPALPYPPPRHPEYTAILRFIREKCLPSPARAGYKYSCPGFFRWPVFRCPPMAGFKVSAEANVRFSRRCYAPFRSRTRP